MESKRTSEREGIYPHERALLRDAAPRFFFFRVNNRSGRRRRRAHSVDSFLYIYTPTYVIIDNGEVRNDDGITRGDAVTVFFFFFFFFFFECLRLFDSRIPEGIYIQV